jgi:orotidine 5'-phosphate decarboxylase subfamily 1
MLRFSERAKLQTNPIARKLFLLMEAKQSNLSLSTDVTSKAALLDLVEELGPAICLLKTHMDVLTDADRDLTIRLTELAQKHQFLIFEDRKFADIGNTVRLQYEAGPLQIAAWADMVNFHPLPGPGILAGLKAAKGKAERGFIVLSQMSAKGNLITPEYSAATVELAETNPDEVIGFICQERQSSDPRFLHMTPGVNLAKAGDPLGQQYRTPEKAIVEQGCDIIIVGRGILEASNRLEAAEAYRAAGWAAYQKTL